MRPHIAESARFAGSRVRGAWVLKVHPLYRSARTLQLLALMARTFDELDAWQLANSNLASTSSRRKGSVTRDFKFLEQLRDSAASAPRKVAEGFGRYKPPQFRQFLDVAIASLSETSNHLRDGVDRKHFTKADIDPLLRLVRRASGAAIGLKKYLKDRIAESVKLSPPCTRLTQLEVLSSSHG